MLHVNLGLGPNHPCSCQAYDMTGAVGSVQHAIRALQSKIISFACYGHLTNLEDLVNAGTDVVEGLHEGIIARLT